MGGSVLTREQARQYEREGFLIFDHSILPPGEVIRIRERVDRLFDGWPFLPRRLAPGLSAAGGPPDIAQLHRVMAMDRVLARSDLVHLCRQIAGEILKSTHPWCHYDTAIYKFPGAGFVEWHQDAAQSPSRLLVNSVHFWIPLNEHTMHSGSLVFLPGSHKRGPMQHQWAHGPAFVVRNKTAAPERSGTVSAPLPIGAFSVHTPWTLHSSEANTTDSIRKALVLQFGSSPWSATRQIGLPLVNLMFMRKRIGTQVPATRHRS